MCQRRPIYTSVTGVVAMVFVLGGPTAMAASTNPLPYTVSVSGSWNASFSSTLVTRTNSGANAPAVAVPANQPFTPTGTVAITIPAIPAGDSYDGGSWSFSAPGLYTNSWCPTVLKTWKIPASGGSITVPTAKLFGTMPAVSSSVSPCVIGVQAPTLLGKSGYMASAQIPIFYLGLPVQVLKPKPSPSPTPTPSPSPTPKPTPVSSNTPPSSTATSTQSTTATSSPTPRSVPSQAPPSSATPTPSVTVRPKSPTAPSTTVRSTPKGSRDTKPSRSRQATEHPARVAWTWGILLLLLLAAGVMAVILIRRRNAGK